MVNSVRTVNLLPEIFQTPVNKQFLNATIDQLTQEPQYKQTQGYIGQKVGPGVNPNDYYVIEPTASRRNYQLEPGVISVDPVTAKITDAITYPGILDAINTQGGITNQADRLFESEYYSWDPFVDFDKINNYSQYYWVPQGPQTVTVAATTIPTTQTFTVSRTSSGYTFSGYNGVNPTLSLARTGAYQFVVAQNTPEAVNYRVTNSGTSGWSIEQELNPTLTLVRGNTYTWNLVQNLSLAFYIKTELSFGTTNLWLEGVTNSGATRGTVTFTVPQDAPDTLYYCNDVEFNFRGQLNIVDATTGTGPEFWIQTEPGIDGVLSYSPNISSRTVLGVSNNGTDLGTVTFDVPAADAQNFYYSMTSIGTVNLVAPSTLSFNQINNVPISVFLTAYPNGIDGITNLNGRTIIFTNNDTTVQTGIWQIQYVVNTIKLNFVQAVAESTEQFTINFGLEYANTQWYRNSSGLFEQIPLLTSALPFVYYQDSVDPTFFGVINLIQEDTTASINIEEEILGHKNYTSPNGVVFTNGLNVTFQGTVFPSSYQGKSYYVYGVGSSITLIPVSDFITPETYLGQVSIPYDKFPYGYTAYDANIHQPLVPDYMTISMASPDLNPWTRSNRWFHKDVIAASAAYNKSQPVFIDVARANRPILEFRSGLKLYNFGTQGVPSVNIIDLTQTDALLNVNGQTGYGTDGYQLAQGSLIIFAVDSNPNVRNQIYQVNFVIPAPEISTTPVINLVPVSYSPVLANQTTVCLNGNTLTGVSFYYDSTNWYETQQKTQVNQPPLFDVFNSSGYSFGDTSQYPSSNFVGCKLLSYAENPDNPVDAVLGIPLSFFSLDNIGDILFDNNLYTDTFIYTPSGVGITVDVSSGFVRQYANRTDFVLEIGWQTAAIPSLPRQQFQFTYNTLPLQLDVVVETSLNVPPLQIFINNVYQLPSTYTYITDTAVNTTTITLNGTGYVVGDVIEVLAYSQQVSNQGFYQIPINLENNPFNGNSKQFTLGTIRQQYSTICENLVDFTGVINGPNNSRDLGNIVPYGQQILQQSSPLTLAGYFLRSLNYNVFAAIEFNSREYVKYKNKLLNAVTQLDIGVGQSVSSILDTAITYITKNNNSNSPFYWSDMLPVGSNYTSNSTTVNPITRQTFNTIQTYNFTSGNYLGLLVYVNGVLLLRGSQYTVSTDAPKLTILIPLNVGDVVTINEYPTTVASWCPNTPSKMGLYPKYTPSLYLDYTYSEPTLVIQGHDGSKTIAFGDIRDEVLIEFEKRIYDNIKVDDNPIPLSTDSVDPTFYPEQTTALLPGFFRTTPYTYAEINQIMSESFLSWVGQNRVNYTEQDYIASNPFTWNYSQSANRINQQQLLQGNWRGLYLYFYDTETPNTTPWEMLGFSEEPAWWTLRYGPAPYTSGNTVLWDDLEAGLVANPAGPYILPEYARPGLTKIIPSGTEGELLPPNESIVGLTDPLSYQKSWIAGDGGPAQASWWNSSSYPFAIMRMLALTKPAQFFSLFADRDLYRYDTTLGQYLYNKRYRLNASGVEIYGNGTSKASYINWIVDYNQQTGVNSTTDLTNALSNLDVRLCYRMASFSDPMYIQIFTERAGPESTNNNLEITPSSYNVLFYKNQPFNSITYSSVIVEIAQLGSGGIGYTVYGYSNIQPYFNVQISNPVGLYKTITAGDQTVQVPSQYTQNVKQIPYGYTFTNTAGVCDFLLGYGTYLESQGLTFANIENGYTLNWFQMATEFLNFATQNWTVGTIINLNPCATSITSTQPISIVDTIASVTPENMLLDQNFKVLDVRTMIVNRDNNTFTLTTTNNQTINYLTLQYTNYEDMIVLNNTSQFNDLIYDPITAARQIRLKLTAATTTQWDGQLNAQGFILNLNNIEQWNSYTKYTKGVIVLYKNTYWQALVISEPQKTFNYSEWVKSDYQAIDNGLLPNLANKANQLANAYNVYEANLTSDNNLFAFGLIGFRPRQYMTNMNLNGVSQVQLYQQFIGTKGTLQAAEIFNAANLGKESGQYKIYENWAILSGTYGAQANRSFFEIQLNQALLNYNPSTIQVINPGEASQANQTLYLNNLWKESYAITSTNILPTTYENSSLPSALPSAGYVCLDDIDITVFDIANPTSIDTNLSTIGIGTYIWIAKVNSYDWGVYRVNDIFGQMTRLSDNLNGTSTAQFNQPHGLAVSDLIIIKYFNSGVDGVYRILGVPSPTTFTISFTFTNTNVTFVTGTGLIFHLQNARVSQASDISTLPYVNSLVPGSKAWVDNDGNGHWETLEKQSPFVTNSTISQDLRSSAQYATSVAQAYNNVGLLVGAPNLNTNQGGVYCYFHNSTTDYEYSNLLKLTATATQTFGNFVSFGSAIWAVVGAKNSNSGAGYAAVVYRNPNTAQYSITQLLVAPDLDFSSINFGTAGTISADERWMYISAPAKNIVYAYERIDVETQSVTYTSDGFTSTFNYSNSLQINGSTHPGQLTVTFNDSYTAILNIDYTVSATSVIFTNPPSANQIIKITRNQQAQLDDYNYYDIQQSSTSGFGVGAIFTVNVVRGLYSITIINGGLGYEIGDTIVINGNLVGGATPANNITLTVTNTVNSILTGFTISGTGNYSNTSFALNSLLYNATNYYNFSVTVNGQLQRPYLDYTFNSATTVLTFASGSVPALGAKIIVITDTYWQYVTYISSNQSLNGDNFGISVSTTTDGRQIMVGAPNASVNDLTEAGVVYIFDRSVIRYIVSNTSQMTYTVPGNVTYPLAVSVNNIFLLTTAQSYSGQYSVNGNTVTFTNIEFTVGDIIEIETNQIQQIQQLTSSTANEVAMYGSVTAACPLNCSVYVGAPFDSTYVVQAGSVDHQVNQSRVYGTTTSTFANPILIPGGTLRINNSIVTVPASPNNTVTGFAAAINASNVPNIFASATPDLQFSCDGSTSVFYIGNLYETANNYTTVVYVNAIIQGSADYSYDPSTKSIYFVTPPAAGNTVTVVSGRLTIGVLNSAAATAGNLLTVLPGVVNSVFDLLEFETFIFTQQILSPLPVVYGQFGASLSIDSSAVNLIVGSPNGNVYEPTTFDSGKTYFDEHSTTFFNPIINGGVAYTYDYFPSSNNSPSNPGQFAFGQQIYNSNVQTGDAFGTSSSYVTGKLVVGATGGPITNTANYGYIVVFDNPTNSPAWKAIRTQQPVVDVYSINSVFAYNGNQEIGVNSTINGATQTYFDFFDPLQGKILGLARQNINYIGAVDPAQYNTGSVHNNGNYWGPEHLGEMWWDTNTVRFIDPNQDDIVYASRRWGQTFPGSSVDVYQWIESTSPPVSYTGQGTVLSTISYSISSQLGKNNIFTTLYYYWVKGITTIQQGAGKTLSANGVASYIYDPRSSGLPYIAGLNSSTIAIYNAKNILSSNNTILSIGFDQQLNDAIIHQEYQIIKDGISDSFLNTQLYRKFQDSLCGVDRIGNLVPDPLLSPGMKYGVEFRPRQSMFADRFLALKNYLTRANTILAQYPISETRSFTLLDSSEPLPPQIITITAGSFVIGKTYTISTLGNTNFTTIGAANNTIGLSFVATGVGSGTGTANTLFWNFEVPNLEVLGYQNLSLVPVGYRYLVDNDSTQSGRWTIYEVESDLQLSLVQIQHYNTPEYWYYINWYLPGYNYTQAPVAAVQNYGQLGSLSYSTAPVGSSVRVINNGAGKYEIWLRTGVDPVNDWQRVGLEDGTIQFAEDLWNYTVGNFGFDSQVFDSQYFDETPQTETRYIIQALNEQIYINDLLYERNSSLILMFNYVYSEFTDPSWLIKTSYVDVDHTIRNLLPYQTYLPDNQEFVIDYFQEVKPYHVQVKQFNLIYDGKDTFGGDLTDFDLPAIWNSTLQVPQFVSPVINYNMSGLPYTIAQTTHYSTVSDAAPNAQLWLEPSTYSQWYNNFLLSIDGVIIENGGSGYTTQPTVTFSSPMSGGILATGYALINSNGQVTQVVMTNVGSGYINTATITFSGGNGTGAIAYPIMNNSLVRSFRVIVKYDRYEYNTSIVEWMPGGTYTEGTQVRYKNIVYQANINITNTTFVTTATLTTGSNRIFVTDASGIIVGQIVDGPGIANNTTVLNISGNTITLSALVLNTSPSLQYTLYFYQQFIPSDWTLVKAKTLSGVNRTMGYYVSTPSTPGLSLPLLIDGIDYPGVQVSGLSFNQDTGFDRGNFDFNPWDNLSIDANGQPTYDLGILDTIFASSYLDPYLGTRPSDININGGAYVDTYESHAPEELVPGIEFDTMDFRVYTTPGADWAGVGHGFPLATYNSIYRSSNPTIRFGGLEPYPVLIEVVDYTQGYNLLVGVDYTVNWTIQTVIINTSSSRVVQGDQIGVNVYELGGGNQLYKQTYTGSAIVNPIIVPVQYALIQEFAIFVNGAYLNNTEYTYTSGTTYGTTAITFNNAYTSTDFISLVAIGPTTINNTTVHYSWSVPIVQTISSTNGVYTYNLDPTISLQYTNPVNAVVTLAGNQLVVAGGISYIGDGVTTTFEVAQRLGFDQSTIVDSDVLVYFNDIPQVSGYTVNPQTLGTTVTFASAPLLGTRIYIAVTTGSQAVIDPLNHQITFRNVTISAGETITITTWHDTREQRLETQVFVGPITEGVTISEGFDDTEFDQGNITGEPGSYSYSIGTTITSNNLDLGRLITNVDRLRVSLNGQILMPIVDYTVSGTMLILPNTLQSTDVVIITSVTDSIVPEAMEFRIFQDMRGVQATYRMTPQTTTSLTASVSATADIIYVNNASALTIPNFSANIWGVVTINGERIMYREIDTNANTISSLLRGTAGTAAASHSNGSIVYDMGRGNLLPKEFQDYVVSNNFVGDGTTTTYIATNINIETIIQGFDTVLFDEGPINLEPFTYDYSYVDPLESVEVYVGGIKQIGNYTITTLTPVTVVFTTAPANGSEVTILVKRGVTWYNQGFYSASDGVPLQETNTPPARFLRGLT